MLSINEAVLQFENDSPYVEVEVGAQEFERREIKVGLSDGILIEILKGLSTEDKIKNVNKILEDEDEEEEEEETKTAGG